DRRCDMIVAYNVLMDLDDVPATLREMRRVLRPSGQLVISLVHPFSDQGTFSSTEPDSPFVGRGTYFGREPFEGTEERNGLRMHFQGWSKPLEPYAAVCEGGRLAFPSPREPIPDLAQGHEYLTQWKRIPLFLWLKARRL